MKRKEDPRFIQGKGNYVDDLSLPGMLYMAIVRSPYPHAEIKNIDISEALKVPGVKAVITGKDLEAAGLGWLPTFHGFDKQMVLAIGKVLFQYQEVAAVFAETRGGGRDGVEAVQVDYDPLPVVADPFTAKKDEVLLRPDRESKTNHIFHWEVGDKDGTAQALDAERRSASSSGSGSSAVIRRRSSPAAASRTSTRWGACSSTSPRRRRTSIARRCRSSPASPRTRSMSSRRTSAAGSATRCRSTRATSARSSARSRSAGRSSGSKRAPRT